MLQASQRSLVGRPARVIALAMLALTGCAAESPNSTSAPEIGIAERADPALAVEGEGLRLFDPASGAARSIGFGMRRDDLLAALAFRGPPGLGTNAECGAGPLGYASWPDGLTLYFQEDSFAGWSLDGRADGALTTAAGIGPGTTRAALEAAYAITIEETSLGIEFVAGGFAGLLDGASPNARITDMWAGMNCVFR